MPGFKFSDQSIMRLAATNKTVWFSDEVKDGLRLAVGKKSKTFYFTKRHPESKQVLTIKIGRHPAISVAAARRKAGDLFTEIENGADPAAVKKAREANTLQSTLDAYIRARTNSKKLSDKCAQDYRDILRIHSSDWLPLPLHKITTRDFEERFIEMSDKPYAANKWTRIMRQLFAYAQKHDPSVRSPALVVEYHPEQKRTPLTGADWGAHLKNILAVENIVRRNAWLLLWLTGIRSTNLRTLTWEDVDLDKRTVHLKKMKNGRARTLPLSDISVALFKQLRPFDKTYCFPSFKRRGPIDHLDTLDTGRQHDMRHLFVTAAGLCHLPEYMIAFLKGDVVEQSMVQRYFDDLGEHAASDAISRKILERCGVLPEAFLGLIASDRITSSSPSPTSSADPRTGEAALALDRLAA